jgi:hypothetical protein
MGAMFILHPGDVFCYAAALMRRDDCPVARRLTVTS